LSSVLIHFPDGSREFRYPPQPLNVGDVIAHDGARWRVLAINSADGRPQTVTVEPDSDDLRDTLSSERGGIQLVLLG
jgi:hypothetical protein